MSAPVESIIHVLRVITTLEPEVGGPSHSAVNAAVAEQGAGVKTTIASTVDARHPAASPSALRKAGIEHRTFRRHRLLGAAGRRWGVSTRFAFFVLKNARRFDVVHVHYVWSVGTLVGIAAGLVARKPVVMTPHESLTSFDIETSRSTVRRWQKRGVKALLLAGVDRVVTASRLELLDSGVGARQGRVIEHPVPPSVSAPPRIGESTATIGYLGRLHPKKRVGDLVEASTMVPSATLLIGGNQPAIEFERVGRAVLESPNRDRITMLGFVGPAERDAFFGKIDVLVMPSTYECFGMVAAEALSAGVPVVVTETTGIADIVRSYDAGVVVPPGSPRQLAAAIASILNDPGRHKALRRNAREAADQRLSFGAYASAIRCVYEEVL